MMEGGPSDVRRGRDQKREREGGPEGRILIRLLCRSGTNNAVGRGKKRSRQRNTRQPSEEKKVMRKMKKQQASKTPKQGKDQDTGTKVRIEDYRAVTKNTGKENDQERKWRKGPKKSASKEIKGGGPRAPKKSRGGH